MNIGIVGNGYVGNATALLKSYKFNVVIYDKDNDKCSPKGTTLNDLLNSVFVFVCVPTPMRPDGSCETGIVEAVVGDLTNLGYPSNRIIVRSTVPVGTCSKLNVMFMPEFLTERNWEKDVGECKEWVLGTNNRDDKARDEVYDILSQAHKDNKLVYKPNLTFATTQEAELAKYTRNCFLALKVSFFNEIEDFCYCDENIDYDKVKSLVGTDNRIGMSHTAVPGPDGKRGYGGTCFPKDMNSLQFQFSERDVPCFIIKSAQKRNESHDRAEKDWEMDRGRAVI